MYSITTKAKSDILCFFSFSHIAGTYVDHLKHVNIYRHTRYPQQSAINALTGGLLDENSPETEQSTLMVCVH